jgi:hypothetical protein
LTRIGAERNETRDHLLGLRSRNRTIVDIEQILHRDVCARDGVFEKTADLRGGLNHLFDVRRVGGAGGAPKKGGGLLLFLCPF